MTDWDLEELLKACRAGNALAWEALVRMFQKRIYGLAFQLLGNPEDARDAAQEAFVKVYRNLDTLPQDSGFIPWLLALTRHVCIDHLRRLQARPQVSGDGELHLSALTDFEPTPEMSAESNQRRHLLFKALHALAPASREVIVLKDLQGMSVEEVATLLEIAPGTVKSRANRARLELARQLAPQWEGA